MTLPRHSAPWVFALLAGLLVGPAFSAVAPDGQVLPRAQWSRFNGWEVADFTVSGVPSALASELRGGLEYSGRRRLLRGLVRPAFQAAAVAKDVRRVRLFLARNGYPASRVQVRLVPDERTRRVALRLEVTPGAEVRIGKVEVVGWPADLDRPGGADSGLPAAGDRFTDPLAEAGVRLLRGALLDAGYAQAAVGADVRSLADGRVALIYTVAPGDSYIIGSVGVEGCSTDLLPLARRVLGVRRGDRFRSDLLADAATDLRATQLFSQVDLATAPGDSGELALDVQLADARMRSWEASVGSWSDNPWMVRAGWSHRNAFTRGRGVRVSGVYASHDRRLGAEVFSLGWLSPRAVTSLGGEWIREDEEAYRADEYAARLHWSVRPRGRGLWQMGVSISHNEVVVFSPDAEDLPTGQDWLLEIYTDRKWDWTDDVLYPTRGGFVRVGLTYAPARELFGASYVRAQADAAAYLPLTGPLGAAARLRLGWARPLGGDEDLLANRRFFAGGYNTMRGYARRRLGPRDADDNPRGGQATVLAGAELRAHLVWICDAAIFVDAGDVWRRTSDANLRLLRVAAGADLDLRTPLGPLRVGHAWNVGPMLTGEPRNLWHFGIGYPW